MDREKVIEGIRHCYEVKGCDGCPYEEGCAYAFDNDEKPHCPIMDDILSLLKEQDEEVRNAYERGIETGRKIKW